MTKEEKAAYDKVYKAAHKERIAEQKALWYQANKEKQDVRNRAWARDNSGRICEYSRKWRENNPERKKAHNAVGKALASGKLVSLPCSECGETKTVAHHYAYDMPLDVIWLCRKHHTQLHKEHSGYEQLPQ